MHNEKTKIDTSIQGWFRALRAVDSQFQSWECIGWFRTIGDAKAALRINRDTTQQESDCNLECLSDGSMRPSELRSLFNHANA